MQPYSSLKESISNWRETFIYVILGLVIFQLSIMYSKDWVNYKWQYDTMISVVDWHSFFQRLSMFNEPLYKFSAKFFGQLIGYQTFIFITTTVLLTVKLHFLEKITKSLYVSTFFYICFYLFLFEGTAIRVGYAVTFVIAGLYFLKLNKWFYAFILIVVASQIHLTALVFLIAFPIYYYRRINVAIYILFVLSVLIAFFDLSFVSIVQPYFVEMNPKYIMYFYPKFLQTQNSTGLFHYFIVFFILLISLVFYYLKSVLRQDKFMQTMFLITVCAISLMIVFHDYVAFSARLGELLLVPVVILLTKLYAEFQFKRKDLHRNVLVVFSLLFLLARVMYLYPTMFFG